MPALDKETLATIAQAAVFAQVEKQRNNALNEVANLSGDIAQLRKALEVQLDQNKLLQASLQNLQASLQKVEE